VRQVETELRIAVDGATETNDIGLQLLGFPEEG
jgi:hypothetical protein